MYKRPQAMLAVVVEYSDYAELLSTFILVASDIG